MADPRIVQALMQAAQPGADYTGPFTGPLPGMTQEQIEATAAAQEPPLYKISPQYQAQFDEAVAAMPQSQNIDDRRSRDQAENSTAWANSMMGHATYPDIPAADRVAYGFSMFPSPLAKQAGLDNVGRRNVVVYAPSGRRR